MPRPARAPRRHPPKPRRWWQHPAAKWAGVSVATPVLVGVITWLIQQSLTPASPPAGVGATPSISGSPSLSSTPSEQVSQAKTTSPSPGVAADAPPVAVDLVRLERNVLQGNTWVARDAIHLSKSDLAQLNAYARGSREEVEWFRAHGAVDPHALYIKIVLRGARDEKVRIIGARAIPRCEAPLEGTLFLSPPAGQDENIKMVFDLDQAEPRAQFREHGGLKDYFAHKTISLERDEDVTIQVEATTNNHYCEFELEFEVLTRQGVVSQTVDDQGVPFRVSALLRDKNASVGDGISDVALYKNLYVSGLVAIGNGGKWEQWEPKAYIRAYRRMEGS
jgi:hypothetical protein